MRHLILLLGIAVALAALDLATRSGPAPSPPRVRVPTPLSGTPGVSEAPKTPEPRRLPLEVDEECLATLGELHRNAEREALEGLIERILAEQEGIGDQALKFVGDSDLSDVSRYGAMLLLRTCLVLKSHGRMPERRFFAAGRDGVVLNLLLDLIAEPGVHDPASMKLWRMAVSAQVVQRGETRLLLDLIDRTTSREGSTARDDELMQFLLYLLAQCLDAPGPAGEMLALLEELRGHQDWRVRRLAYDRLAASGLTQIDALSEELIQSTKDRDAIFLSLCRQVPAEELPFLLVRARDEKLELDYEHGLAAYLERSDAGDYSTIIYLHGDGRESDEYRRRAVQAINFVGSRERVGDDLLEQVFDVFYKDPSPKVRVAALLVLSLSWDGEDAAGFEALAARIRDPNTDYAVGLARSNFEDRRSRQLSGHPGLEQMHERVRTRLSVR